MKHPFVNRLAVACAALIFAVACSEKPATNNQALLVAVTFEAGATAQCVRGVATPQTGSEAVTEPIARKDTLLIAVDRAASWSGNVTLVARGYATCAAAADVLCAQDASVTRARRRRRSR